MRKKRNYWSIKKCRIVAKKCKSKSEFHRKYSSAYDISYKRGWLVDICSHMKQKRKIKNYWSIEKAIEVVKLCKNKTELQKKYPRAYVLLRTSKILNDVCINMIRPTKKRKWTKKNCLIEAKKYANRNEWVRNGGGSYNVALKNKWVDECTQHMVRTGSKFKRLVYVFEFPDNSVYVGLTYNSKERRSEHLNPNKKKKSTVYQHIKKTGLQPEFKELSEYLNKDIASKKEGEFLQKYKDEGWIILNRTKTGGLGGSTLKWSKEACIIESKKYDTRSNFQKKSSGAYASAKKNGWFNECIKHMKNLRNR